MYWPIIWFAHLISAIAAINFGLIKFFDFNLFEYPLREVKNPLVVKAVYAMISILGFYSLLSLFTP